MKYGTMSVILSHGNEAHVGNLLELVAVEPWRFRFTIKYMFDHSLTYLVKNEIQWT